MGARVTYILRTEIGIEFKIIGTGLTYEMAKAEADAKVAVSCGVVISATKSEDIDPGEWQEPFDIDTGSSKMVLSFARNHGDPKKDVELSHAARKFSDKLQMNGTVDLKNELIKKLAEALTDSKGQGGYRPISGEYMTGKTA